MALSCTRWRFSWGVLCLSFIASCAGDASGDGTEVLVSIDALGEARKSSSVRVEVNAAVVELAALSGGRWPLEVLVTAPEEMADKTFRVRAWGLSGEMINGAGEKAGTFRKGKRTELEITLDPALDLGPPPAVNAELGPGKIVRQPVSAEPEMDAGGEPQFDAAQEAGPITPEPDAGPDAAATLEDAGPNDCDAAGTCDGGASEKDACVPGPMDCGGCGVTCVDNKQCINDQCLPNPAPNCEQPLQIAGRTYQYCHDLRSWDSARVACRARGYDLAIMNTLDEHMAVGSALANVAVGDYWLGGHDRGDNGAGIGSCTRTSAEGIWRWVDPLTGSEQGPEFCRFANSNATSCTATNGAFMVWRSGQPDNSGCSCGLLNLGNCTNAEDCLVMGADGWNDAACSAARTYLCEG